MIISRQYAKLQRLSIRLDTHDLDRIIGEYLGNRGYIIGDLKLEWEKDDDYNTICVATSTAEKPDENSSNRQDL